MKLSIILLFGLGVIAAISAAMLVTSIQAGSGLREVRAEASLPTELTIVVATRDLQPMSVLEASAVELRTVPAAEAPADPFASPTLVIGKVLLQSVDQGQGLSASYLAREGSGVHVASALPPGMRAVSVALSDRMGLEGLLYPGSVVDVIASMTVHEDLGVRAQPVSVTLLQGVFVLAVGGRSVVSEPAHEAPVATGAGHRRPNVTLLVDPKQAEMLKLAMQEGSVSLVLRNPTDESLQTVEGTSLRSLAPVLGAGRTQQQVVVTKGGVAEIHTFRIAGGN